VARPWLERRASWEPVAEALARSLAQGPSPKLPAAQAVEPAEGRVALGAVDGGSAVVLDGGGLAVGAVRAHGLAWRSHAPEAELPAPLEVRLLDDALAEELERRLPGLPPAERPGMLVERWRALREWELAMRLGERLQPGDALALDGPVAQHDWPGDLQARLAERCGRRGVLLVGVCKSASARVDGQPALLAAQRAARGVRAPWLVPLPPARPGAPAALAASLCPGGKVFRVELGPRVEPAEAVGLLAAWSRDAGSPGYPYPLALAHQRCALDEALVADLAEALRGAAARHGADAAAWEEVFGDFHDVLDRGN
jgi:hypothetical protein